MRATIKAATIPHTSTAFLALAVMLGIPWAAHAAESAVNLRSAADYVILTKTGVTNTGATAIVGHVGTSPIASTAITGFGLKMDASGRFSTSSRVNGKVFAANYANPTPTMLHTAILDMQTAYDNAAARTNPRASELGGGNIGGLTLRPGLYKWSSNVTIPTDVTLEGGKNAIWIFQIAGTLDIASGKRVILKRTGPAGSPQTRNIFWQVAGQTTLATSSLLNGIVLGKTAIVMQTGAALHGRALAQTAVTLDNNTVRQPPVAVADNFLSALDLEPVKP